MIKKIFSKNGPYYWFTSPWIISIILTSIYIFTYPEFFNIYKTTYKALWSNEDTWKSYEDLDCDGRDDVLSFVRRKLNGKTEISCFDEKFFLSRDPIFDIAPFVGDYNNDGAKEVYFLSQSKDSVFLSIWDYKKNINTDIFLQTIEGRFKFNYLGFIDSNDDGFKEFYLWACSLRTISKRSVLKYDIRNKVLSRTKGLDARLFGGYIKVVDGEPKIVLSTISYTTKDTVKANYCEKKAWLFVLDKDLKFVFDPIKYDKSNYCLASMNVKDKGEDRICVVSDCNKRSGKEKGVSFISIYDYSGDIVREKVIEKDLLLKEGGFLSFEKNNNSKILLTSRLGGVLKYNTQLTFEGLFFPGGTEKPKPYFVADVDQNGEKEIFLFDQRFDKIVITRDDLSHPVVVKLLEPYSNIKTCKPIVNNIDNIHGISPKKRSKYVDCRKENIFVRNKSIMYFINYFIDGFFWLKYVYALTVFLVSFLIVWWIRYFVSKSIEEKYAVENTIAQLKFQNVSNQMSPHFTLNAMNSIASLIYKEDRETAYDYLCKLAKLVRNSLVNANILERSLKEELDFVSSYLELQKFRFKNRFDYFINVDNPSVYNYNVMPFLIQTFVENAMKHGLKDVGSGGKVIVEIQNIDNGIKIIIEDNGQGRKAASKNNGSSTGKGIKLVNEYINILNKKDDRNMSVCILDLEEERVAKGTRVEIFIDKV